MGSLSGRAEHTQKLSVGKCFKSLWDLEDQSEQGTTFTAPPLHPHNPARMLTGLRTSAGCGDRENPSKDFGDQGELRW